MMMCVFFSLVFGAAGAPPSPAANAQDMLLGAANSGLRAIFVSSAAYYGAWAGERLALDGAHQGVTSFVDGDGFWQRLAASLVRGDIALRGDEATRNFGKTKGMMIAAFLAPIIYDSAWLMSKSALKVGLKAKRKVTRCDDSNVPSLEQPDCVDYFLTVCGAGCSILFLHGTYTILGAFYKRKLK